LSFTFVVYQYSFFKGSSADLPEEKEKGFFDLFGVNSKLDGLLSA
jgi:hypothetical protein